MMFVQASSTPRTISARSLSENGKSPRNFRTKPRINARLAVWLVNLSFCFFIAEQRSAQFGVQSRMKPNWIRLRQGYGVTSSFEIDNGIGKRWTAVRRG